jgi:two-component system OmpR family sensor kinase
MNRPQAADSVAPVMARVPWLTRFARLPIRARLTVAFAGVIAIVLAAAGVFLYAQFKGDLDRQIDEALNLEARDIAALVHSAGPAAVVSSGEERAQVYTGDGRLLASTAGSAGTRLLSAADARRAVRRPQRIERRTLSSGSARVIAVPVRGRDGARLSVAVGDPLRLRDHELGRLGRLLLIAGPLALLLASVAGHELARAALRPVDHMRAQSERITEHELSERLSVPESSDEIGALARTLNAMLDRMEVAVSRERRLVSDASHELRTPLTTLRAEVDLALLGDRDPAELRDALESASEEAKRMSRLADDLLVLARADQGRLPLNPQPVPARDLLEAAAGRARAAVDLRGRSIVVDGLPSGRAVSADPDRTAQALDNLVTNALRYGDGTITLSARDDGELVELHVTDDGGGFADDLLARAFERFGRGDEARAGEPGSGLGLALVEAVAEAHGGHAGARNRPEGGADVWIALPRG